MLDSIAAAGFSAGAGAGITIHQVTVVAGFARVQAPITTALLLAAIGAAIAVVGIAIVAFLIVEVLDPITTTGGAATAGTGIAVILVAIVAGFTFIDSAVAAALLKAALGATIAIVGIPIIALLIAVFFGLQVEAPHPIAAAGRLAGGRTGIAGGHVAVITALHARLDDAVPTPSRCTTGQARICVDCVAIIAEFTGLNIAIAATGRTAVGTAIGGIIIAVIAALTGADDPVAAAGDAAIAATGVIVVVIAIVAFLVATDPFFSIGANHTITAASRDTTDEAAIVVGIVAVVAGFKAGFAFRSVASHDAIPTDSGNATAQAGIGVFEVPVITGFILVSVDGDGDTIAAAGEPAGAGAEVGVDGVAIITFLLEFDLTVAAGCLCFTHHDLFRTGREHEEREQKVTTGHHLFSAGPLKGQPDQC